MVAERYAIEWAPVASRDLEGILEYLAQRDSWEAAEAVALAILDRVERLSSNPTRCRIVPELKGVDVLEYRESIVAPYRLIFRLEGRRVAIVGILDGRRDLREILVERASSGLP